MNTDTDKSFANPEVLAFYKELPFNYQETAEDHVKRIKASDALDNYPMLRPLLKKGVRVLEVGCGAGWLSNAMAYHHGAKVTAIDFNPVVIERAKEITRALPSDVDFREADLFTFRPDRPADLALSVGVLHHTDNCLEAVRRMFTDFTAPGGHCFIGLYHRYGRKPFLDHFEELKAQGVDEETLYKRYCELDRRQTDETHRRSWFRDQVLHPMETQHTLAEILPLMEESGMTLVSTSINKFQPITSLDALCEAEKELEAVGRERLAQNVYFPGFFVFLARMDG